MMQVWGIVILVILGIIVVVLTIARKRLFFNRAVFFIAIIGVALIVISNIFGRSNTVNAMETPKYIKNAPGPVDAPGILQTNTRVYYVAAYIDTPEALTLTAYYLYNEKKWEYSTDSLPFDKSNPDYKGLKVIIRKGG